MNLQEFLENEFKSYGVRISEDEDHFEYDSPTPSKILDFVNKVLSEVQMEVKKKQEEYNLMKRQTVCQDILFNHAVNVLKETSTIIDQLKLK